MNKEEARKLVSKIANKHSVNIRFSKHALDEIKKDNLTISDILNVIKSSHSRILSDAEFENGSYRYRLETAKIMVVIAFISKDCLVVVTSWRK